ncbi:JmjC domain-containing protein, partial [Xenorhabdus bovienii]|uniref:JmjC domain-containing protein n=1 Tax=Xenorhabdus bovienii TaxID=40576 RepID=UPI003DA3FDAE
MKKTLLEKIFDQQQREIFIEQVCRQQFHSWYIVEPQVLDELQQHINLPNLIFQEKGRWGGVRVAAKGQQSENILHCTPTPPFLNTLFEQGYTLVFNDMQDKIFPVYQIALELSSLLYAGVNCNCYVTPPQTQGLERHYDDEDVIVLQLSGSKRWQVIIPQDNIYPDPQLAYSETYAMHPGKQHHDILLEPGMAMYIPKGTPHEVAATQEQSIHLTFSVSLPMVKDLLFHLIETLSQSQHIGRLLRQNIVLQSKEEVLHFDITQALTLLQQKLPNLDVQ